jgi:hypothetical protein
VKFGNTEVGVLMAMIRDRQEFVGGAGVGAMLHLAISKPKTVVGWLTGLAASIGAAYIGAEALAAMSGLPLKASAAVMALTGHAAARRVLAWVETGKLPIIGGKEGS